MKIPDNARTASVIAAALLAGCGRGTDRSAVAAPAAESPQNPAAAAEVFEETTLPPGQPAAGSIYDLDSTWRNQDGDEIRLGDLRGKVRVLAMGYSTCQYACPRLVADIRKVQQDLDPALASMVGFAFVSIDPETDTPEQLREFAERHGFESDDWTLLTGDEDSVLELAVVLGMKYRRTTEADFAHSNIITVLGRDGEILHQQTGLGEDSAEILAAIRQAAALQPQ